MDVHEEIKIITINLIRNVPAGRIFALNYLKNVKLIKYRPGIKSLKKR